VIIDPGRGQVAHRYRAKPRRDDVLAQPTVLAVVARRWAPLAQPPSDELADAELAIGQKRLEPKALPLRLPFQVDREPLRSW
jgi:hypothetical protein